MTTFSYISFCNAMYNLASCLYNMIAVVVRVQRIHRPVIATSPPPVHGELFKMADSVPVSDDTPPTASASEASQARPPWGALFNKL